MLQYIILGYLVFEILRLSQLADVTALKFAPPPDAPASPPVPVQVVEPPKSETATAKSG